MKLLKIAKETKLGEQNSFVRVDRRRFVGFEGFVATRIAHSEIRENLSSRGAEDRKRR